jgi:hypothetical protein
MHDSIRTQMKQLCEWIASEQDPARFMELVSRLNELLKNSEENSSMMNATSQDQSLA